MIWAMTVSRLSVAFIPTFHEMETSHLANAKVLLFQILCNT